MWDLCGGYLKICRIGIVVVAVVASGGGGDGGGECGGGDGGAGAGIGAGAAGARGAVVADRADADRSEMKCTDVLYGMSTVKNTVLNFIYLMFYSVRL